MPAPELCFLAARGRPRPAAGQMALGSELQVEKLPDPTPSVTMLRSRLARLGACAVRRRSPATAGGHTTRRASGAAQQAAAAARPLPFLLPCIHIIMCVARIVCARARTAEPTCCERVRPLLVDFGAPRRGRVRVDRGMRGVLFVYTAARGVSLADIALMIHVCVYIHQSWACWPRGGACLNVLKFGKSGAPTSRSG